MLKQQKTNKIPNKIESPRKYFDLVFILYMVSKCY